MERIISYDEVPYSNGETLYFRMETDPKLYTSLLSKGYRIISDIRYADESTLYITGRRQDFNCANTKEYRNRVDMTIQSLLLAKGIEKPGTVNFSFEALVDYKYQLPFVLKNEIQNGGREKFLIATEKDYENLINACTVLLNKDLFHIAGADPKNAKSRINYVNYLNEGFKVQQYIETPTEFNTSVRLLTTPSNGLLYAALKYNKPVDYHDETTLLGYLLKEVYPISSKSIVSNTLSGGSNLLLGKKDYTDDEKRLLEAHNINSSQFHNLIVSSQLVHNKCYSELGLICGFDYIYDKEKDRWYLLEYHSRPMVGDYAKRQGISYSTSADRLTAEGRVRATSLRLTLKR